MSPAFEGVRIHDNDLVRLELAHQKRPDRVAPRPGGREHQS